MDCKIVICGKLTEDFNSPFSVWFFLVWPLKVITSHMISHDFLIGLKCLPDKRLTDVLQIRFYLATSFHISLVKTIGLTVKIKWLRQFSLRVKAENCFYFDWRDLNLTFVSFDAISNEFAWAEMFWYNLSKIADAAGSKEVKPPSELQRKRSLSTKFQLLSHSHQKFSLI